MAVLSRCASHGFGVVSTPPCKASLKMEKQLEELWRLQRVLYRLHHGPNFPWRRQGELLPTNHHPDTTAMQQNTSYAASMQWIELSSYCMHLSSLTTSALQSLEQSGSWYSPSPSTRRKRIAGAPQQSNKTSRP